MSIISKEATEVANSGAESPAAASPMGARSQPPQPAPGQFHADAVSLEVPLKIHGSKVIDPSRGGQTEPFEEETVSMIVFPNGGVLRMSTSVAAGQMLVLTNLKSRQDAICRVIKVRNYSGSASYVEAEFTHRQPGYWGVYFESDSAEPAKDAASPAVPKSSLSAVSTATSASADKGGSAFAPIGSHEDVQPPASLTSSSPVAPSARAMKPLPVSPVQKRPADDTVASSPAAPSAGESVLQGSARASKLEGEDVSILEEALTETPQPNAASATTASRSVRSSGALFGASLDSGREGHSSAAGKNWLLIAACAAGLFVVAGGGYFLLQHHSSPVTSHTAQAAAQPEQPVPAQPPAVSQPVQPAAATEARPRSKPDSASVNPVRGNSAAAGAPAAPAKEAAAPATQPEQPGQAAGNSAAGTAVPSMFGALNAHPIASRQSAQQGPAAAPSLDAGTVSSGEPNALQGITSGAAGAPLAPPSLELQPGGPLPVGGRVKEPQIVSRTLPVYPPLARQAHTEGNVVLQVVVDRTGSVSAMSVISGPPTLRQAALDAVRRWKYKPTMLNGQPIAVQMQVSIQFQL